MKRTFLLLSLYLALGSGFAAAQERWTIIVPTAAGGSTDLLTRALAQRLSHNLGAVVSVENLPGKHGTIAASKVARSESSANLLLMATPSSHGIASGIYAALPYDVQADFKAIGMLGMAPYVVAARKQLGLKTIKDLIEAARNKQLTYGSTGIGGPHHLVGEMFNRGAGVSLNHVAYNGGAQALAAVLGGEAQVMFPAAILVLPQVRAGTIDALAITSAGRSRLFPHVPTVAESGLSGFAATSWYALVGAKTMPARTRERWSEGLKKILADPEFVAFLEMNGTDPGGVGVDDLPEFFRQEAMRWGGLAKDLGLAEE